MEQLLDKLLRTHIGNQHRIFFTQLLTINAKMNRLTVLEGQNRLSTSAIMLSRLIALIPRMSHCIAGPWPSCTCLPAPSGCCCAPPSSPTTGRWPPSPSSPLPPTPGSWPQPPSTPDSSLSAPRCCSAALLGEMQDSNQRWVSLQSHSNSLPPIKSQIYMGTQ